MKVYEDDGPSLGEFIRSYEPREVFVPMILVTTIFGFVWLLSWIVQGL